MTQHKSLNCSKGVVRNWELARTDPEEIKENIPMITGVQRSIVKKNIMEIKTNTLILTLCDYCTYSYVSKINCVYTTVHS